MREILVKAEQQKQGIIPLQPSHQGISNLRLTYRLDDEDCKILNWLSVLNFAAKQSDILSRRHEQTGAWFLNSSEFQSWMAGPPRMLWCSGMPGAGKTVLASVSCDYLKAIFENKDVAVLCIFFNYTDPGHQTCVDLVSSILLQLVQTKGVTEELRTIYHRHQARASRPAHEELWNLLQPMIQEFTKVFIIIDALDECPEPTRSAFVGEMHKLGSFAHLLVTSRHGCSVAHEFQDAVQREIHALDTDLDL